MIRGVNSENKEKRYKLILPVAREAKTVNYQKDIDENPKFVRHFLRRMINDRLNVHLKRGQSSLTIYIKYEPIEMHNTLHKILSKHPFPLFQGPLIPHLEKSFHDLWNDTPDSVALNAKTQFTHEEAQPCCNWTPIETGLQGWGVVENTFKDIDSYHVAEGADIFVAGPSCSIDEMRVIYTCQLNKCKIGCPCSICSNIGINCQEECQNRCKNCSPQCRDHEIKLPATFNLESDHFIVVTSGENYYHFATPYAGIPSSCQACSEDVLEHQVLHLIVHLNCKFCRQEFRPYKNKTILSIQDYKKSEFEIYKTENSTCPSCCKEFMDRASRKRHQRRTHGRFLCTDCNLHFSSQRKLQYHQESKHKNISDNESQQKKQSHHIENQQFTCQRCQATFKYDYTLSRHMKEVHYTTEKNLDYVQTKSLIFRCPECSSSFMRKSYLKRHVETVHSAAKKFSCQLCEKDFSRKFSYTRHLKRKICQSSK